MKHVMPMISSTTTSSGRVQPPESCPPAQAAGDSAQQLLDSLPPEVRVAIGSGVEALVATAGAAAHLVEQYPNESAAAAGLVAVPLLINLVFKSGCVPRHLCIGVAHSCGWGRTVKVVRESAWLLSSLVFKSRFVCAWMGGGGEPRCLLARGNKFPVGYDSIICIPFRYPAADPNAMIPPSSLHRVLCQDMTMPPHLAAYLCPLTSLAFHPLHLRSADGYAGDLDPRAVRALLQEELEEGQQAQLRQRPEDCVLIDIREEAERVAAGLPELKLGARYKVRVAGRGERCKAGAIR